MRRPRRTLRGRQVVDPENGVRQLSHRRGPDSSSPTAIASSTSRAPGRRTFSTRGGESSATSASSCASFRASARSTSSRRRRSESGLDAPPRASEPLRCWRGSHARKAVVGAAGDLLGRRTAARQHRARLRRRHRLLILDEPTASLDAANRGAVIDLIAERKALGTGFLADLPRRGRARARRRPDRRRFALFRSRGRMNAAAKGPNAATRLSEAPLVHPSAVIKDSALGRFVEIAERCVVTETQVGDYSYMMQDCETWAARIGKFVNIASHARAQRDQPPDLARDAASFHLSRPRLLAGRGARGELLRLAAREHGHDRPRRLDRPRRHDHAGRDRSATAR